MRFFAGPRLLVIDEVGYLPLKRSGAALFQVITQRYLKSSIVMTTNLGVGSWGKIFDDPMVAAAMLDRLLHRSVVFNIDGESYRMRSHRARTEAPEGGAPRSRSNLDPNNSPVNQLGNFVDRPWGVSEIGGRSAPTRGEREGTTTEMREENARLRREVKRLTMERDLLKRSVAFWVKEQDR